MPTTASLNQSKVIPYDELVQAFVRSLGRVSILPRDLHYSSRSIGNSQSRVKHSMRSEGTTPLASRHQLLCERWALEGECPEWRSPTRFTELQVWHKGKLYRFHDRAAAIRLHTLAPTFFSNFEGRGPVGAIQLGDKLLFMVTGKSLARSYIGATAGVGDMNRVADWIVSDRFKLTPDVKGLTKNQRYYNCLVRVAVCLELYGRKFKNPWFRRLKIYLLTSMLEDGRCETPITKIFLDELSVVLKEEPTNALGELIKGLSKEEQGALWRLRRIISKDDNDPQENARAAQTRMCTPSHFTADQEKLADGILTLHEHNASQFVKANYDALKRKHDSCPLHRSSASLFFSRAQGGGSAEAHLIVALHRLSKGEESPLSNVWGQLPDKLDLKRVVEETGRYAKQRDELLAACEWFLSVYDDEGFEVPYLCIYPEREPKSRTFLLLPYALQQGGIQAATVVAEYLKTRSDTREVYAGFDTYDLLQRWRKDIEDARTDTVMSLDSSVSTDPLEYEHCLRIYRPFFPVFSDFTRRCLERIFSPHRTFIAKGRPRNFLRELTFDAALGDKLELSVQRREVPYTMRPRTPLILQVFEHRVPQFVRTLPLLPEIATSLSLYNRVILSSPTGSGKTVLAASAFNSIIQFPSVAALEIFSKSLDSLQIPHNVYYAQKKEITVFCDTTHSPRSILCTSFFVEKLHHDYPTMLVVLDEADARQENYVYNLFWTKQRNVMTLLMTASPDEVLNEDLTHTITLPGGTNYVIEDRECTDDEMMERLCHHDTPKSLVCTFSEPQCEKIARRIIASGRKALALTARRRKEEDYLTLLDDVDVIVSTNVIRSSVTIPDVVEAYDVGLCYESVDFPLQGIESLVLFKASNSMKIQMRGRVGRTAPGIYWKVNCSKLEAEEYTPRLLARCPLISSKLGKMPLAKLSREFNVGSLVVENFSQQIAAAAGHKYERHRPLFASIVRGRSDGARKSLLAVVAFEAMGIANRLTQMREDFEMREPFNAFQRAESTHYAYTVKTLLAEALPRGWLANELNQIRRWTQDLEEQPGEDFYSERNLQALGLSLWRQVGVVQHGEIIGKWRNFSVGVPQLSVGLDDGDVVVCLGISLRRGVLSAKHTLKLTAGVVAFLEKVLATAVKLELDSDIGDEIPIITACFYGKNAGKQTRHMRIDFDEFSANHVFLPKDLPRIMLALHHTLKEQRVRGSQRLTVRGSPMSSTASFSVLNSLGLAVHDFVRKETGETMLAASIFGDDDIVVASMLACMLVHHGREAVGLTTKWLATGMLKIRDAQGNLLRPKGLSLFTERVIDPLGTHEVLTIKPAGLVRLYQALHPSELTLSTISHLPDMRDYAYQISRKDPELYDILYENAEPNEALHPRRTTGLRQIISQALRSDIGPYEKVAIGSDVNDLVDVLEAAMLMHYPSTRGDPDRVADPHVQQLGHPVVSLKLARELSDRLQNDDCYFKLHRPPLKFEQGPFAIEVATKEWETRGNSRLTLTRPEQVMQELGWGDTLNPTRDGEFDVIQLPEEDPIDFGETF